MKRVCIWCTCGVKSSSFMLQILAIAGNQAVGFVGHAVDGGLFHDRCTVMDSREGGNSSHPSRESMARTPGIE